MIRIVYEVILMKQGTQFRRIWVYYSIRLSPCPVTPYPAAKYNSYQFGNISVFDVIFFEWREIESLDDWSSRECGKANIENEMKSEYDVENWNGNLSYANLSSIRCRIHFFRQEYSKVYIITYGMETFYKYIHLLSYPYCICMGRDNHIKML